MTTITITLPRATVEQALEALWRGVKLLNYRGGTVECLPLHDAITALRAALAQQRLTDAQQEMERSIESLKAALAQEQANPPGCDHCNHPLYAATKCRVCGRVTKQAEPVEPVQQPYCYVYEYDGVFGLHREFYPVPYNGMKPSRTVPVYTAPPQRKPLTEEEIAAEWQKASECASKSEGAVTTSQFVQMFARAIERAHGIPMSEAPACPDCHGVGYDASGQLCACQENPSF